MTVTAKRYPKRLDKEMSTSTTSWSSDSTEAVVEHFLSQRVSHGVFKGARSMRRLLGQLLMKDGVRKARGLRPTCHRQSWSHVKLAVSR